MIQSSINNWDFRRSSSISVVLVSFFTYIKLFLAVSPATLSASGRDCFRSILLSINIRCFMAFNYCCFHLSLYSTCHHDTCWCIYLYYSYYYHRIAEIHWLICQTQTIVTFVLKYTNADKFHQNIQKFSLSFLFCFFSGICVCPFRSLLFHIFRLLLIVFFISSSTTALFLFYSSVPADSFSLACAVSPSMSMLRLGT